MRVRAPPDNKELIERLEQDLAGFVKDNVADLAAMLSLTNPGLKLGVNCRHD